MVDAAALYGPGGRGGEDDLSEELASSPSPSSSPTAVPGEGEEKEGDRELPSSRTSIGGVSWNTRTLDWSGDGDDFLDAARSRLLEAGAAAASASGGGSRLRVAADLDPSSAVGLWVCVHRPGGVDSPAKMYLSVMPLNQRVEEDAEGERGEREGGQAEEEEERDGEGDQGGENSSSPSSVSASSSSSSTTPSSLPEPFAIVAPGIPFRAPDDGLHSATGWSSYRVTLLGGVSANEDHVLWPNQMLHGDRSVHNVRGAADVAGFLVAADKGGVVSHALNLRGLAEFKNREAEWCWELLAQRWGRDELVRLGCGMELFEGLPRRRKRGGPRGRKHKEQQPERHAQAEGEW